ncbi:MAG: pantoate--beta-alanine ligase [Prolixibacteraceae bacterium]
MLAVKEINDLKSLISAKKSEGKTIGFVPTMGALHAGHLSLVKQAGEQTDFVVVSIFVNPTQFNNPNDLIRYPRNLDRDLALLEPTACQLVFAPEVETMYPEPDTRRFNFGALEQVMEGKYRPGHFNGVAQIVSTLFDYIKPDKAFFGLKDFQQLAVIKAMVKKLNLKVEIIPCPIIREASGLALSSRNERLTAEERKNAAHIYKTLTEAGNKAGQMNVKELKDWVIEQIDANEYLKTEYFEIVDDEKLEAIRDWNQPLNKVGCIAVFCGEVRLIDNVVFN